MSRLRSVFFHYYLSLEEYYLTMGTRWVAYTDGSVQRLKGTSLLVGGWGLIMLCPKTKEVVEVAEAEFAVSIGRMELMGPKKAMEIITKNDHLTIWSDSQYVVRAVMEWSKGWAKNEWRGSNGRLIKHQQIIQDIMSIRKEKPFIEMKWVRGHGDDQGNILADQLATSIVAKAKEARKPMFYYKKSTV